MQESNPLAPQTTLYREPSIPATPIPNSQSIMQSAVSENKLSNDSTTSPNQDFEKIERPNEIELNSLAKN